MLNMAACVTRAPAADEGHVSRITVDEHVGTR